MRQLEAEAHAHPVDDLVPAVEAAATGLRKPVNVIEGNYKLAAGVCPWWDGALRGEAAE